MLPARRPVFAMLLAALAACSGSEPAAPRATAPAPAAPPPPRTAYISYADARPVLEARRGVIPAELAGTDSQIEAAWPSWVAQHDAAIRARLAQGDEDSIVNFWLYGTTFTSRPRATAEHLAQLTRPAIEDLLVGRLDDLVAAMAAPGANERVRFARQVVERHGIDVTSDEGRDKARAYLVGVRERVIAETARHRRETDAARAKRGAAAALDGYAAIYRDRGLSSDTSLPVDFAVDRALAALAAADASRAGRVNRVAVIGPGLDFTDKAEGVDVYPQQTIQPFAAIDSLVRLGLANAADVRVTAFDLSPRVLEHVRAAAERGRAGMGYDLQLPLARRDAASAWDPALVEYWKRFGSAIGREMSPAGNAEGSPVQMRAVRVRPDVAARLGAEDLDVVVQRRERDEGFDLILATNVLVYYDPFEQALALANIAAMLRPGGVFVTNYLVHPTAPLEPAAQLVTPVYWDRQHTGDTIFIFRRR